MPHLSFSGSASADVLASILRGWHVPAERLRSTPTRELLHAADEHGVGPLVAERLAGRRDLPAALSEGLRAIAVREAAAELPRTGELRACIEALAEAGVAALVMKGAQLAYSCYDRPDLRPRLDSDILVPWAGRDQVRAPLEAIGYRAAPYSTDALLLSQAVFHKTCPGGFEHLLDLHWRVANPQLFVAYLDYAELAGAAVPVPALGPAARGLSEVHALLVACVHRIAHHYDAERLIWLYDIHLLAERLSPDQWDELKALATARDVGPLCARSLDRANRALGTRIPANLFGTARRDHPRGRAYLDRRGRHVARVAADVRALPRWTDRLRLLQEHLLPSARYMRDVYAPASMAPLPLLYVRRVIRGARKWLRRSSP